ncbi:MAG: hypothetical protein ABIZ64_16845, partial [Casimicrobium sp.]
MLRPILLSTLLLCAATMPALAAAVPSEGRSMPQAVVESVKAVAVERFMGDSDGAYRIDAASWSMPTIQKTMAIDNERAKPVQIGYPRAIPAALQTLPMAILPWKTLADGSRTLQVQVVAAGAAGLRIAYRIDGPASGLELRFSGNARDQVFRSDAVPGAEIAWSPVLEGNTGTVELRILAGFEPTQFRIYLEQLSHLVKVGADLNKDIRDIGTAGSCNVDIACVSNPSAALLNIAKATAKMIF